VTVDGTASDSAPRAEHRDDTCESDQKPGDAGSAWVLFADDSEQSDQEYGVS
jgi:hypothetical protein